MDSRKEKSNLQRFQFDFARPEDDTDLRKIFADSSMPGNTTLRFEREPSFFQSQLIHGPAHQILVCRDRGKTVGVGTRSVQNRYVSSDNSNHKIERIGYLSNLRLLKEYRGRGTILVRAYRYLHERHLGEQPEDRPTLYLTAIAEGNENAIRLLTNNRADLPTYEYAGKYYTYAIPRSKTRRSNRDPTGIPGVHVRPMLQAELDQLLDFIRREGQNRQFFPAYKSPDFFENDSTFLGMRPSDIQIATSSSGEILGTLAIWDQRPFRQVLIESYSRSLRLIKPFYNLAAILRGTPRLPSPETVLPQVMGALPIIKRNDPEIFHALLKACLKRMTDASCIETSADYMMLGLHESDPLTPFAEEASFQRYVTQLYYVYWPEDQAARQQIPDRIPYLELGCL
jgi:hypothetical protein